MVERWNSSISYTNFYQKCKPVYCSFSYQERLNILYIITTVIGLFGGLSLVFQLMSLSLIKLFLKLTNKPGPNNPVSTSSTQVTNDRE
jgi:hypothetical protein